MIRTLGTAFKGAIVPSWQWSLVARAQAATASTAATVDKSAGVQLDPGVIVVPMPSLSHAMTTGRVKRWLKQEGEACQTYDILLELETESLVEEAYRLDDFAGTVTMLIESQEEACMAKILVPEGQEVAVGTPIAVMCEDEDQQQAAAAQADKITSIGNVYEEEQQQAGQSVRTLVWQSYLKESQKEPGGSCGCM